MRAPRIRLAVSGALAACLASAALASAELTQKGDLRIAVGAALSPRRLPRTGTAPLAVSLWGSFETTDGSLAPALRSMRIELNRHAHLQSAGLALCRTAQIQPASSAAALAACRSSLVGRGSFSLEAALGGQQPYPMRGRLLVFNGTYRGRPALLGQIYTAHPFASSFVVAFRIARRKHGRWGTVLSASLPRAFTSWAHVTGLRLRLGRSYRYRGKRRSLISAGCPAPAGFPTALFPAARTSFRFAGGKRLGETLTRGCRALG